MDDTRIQMLRFASKGYACSQIGEKHAGITCQVIVGEAGPQASRNICANILSATHARIINVLADHVVPLHSPG